MKKIKIAHIISGLDVGGAEIMLYRLLSVTDRNIYDPVVISLTKAGSVADKIRGLGISVYECNIKGVFCVYAVFKIAMIFLKKKVDIVQTWMYHADFIGGFIGKVLHIPVVWGIHNTTLVKGKSKLSTIYIAKWNAYLSTFIPQAIICCSQTAEKIHKNMGYCFNKMEFIPNGFDGNLFKMNFQKRKFMRGELGLSDNTFLIGMIARFDQQKDHHNLIQAAKIFLSKASNAKVILCGKDVDKDNIDLVQWIAEAGIEDHVHLLGKRDDVEDIYPMLDVVTVSSSFGEAFPLVLGEAMLCEIVCVATDVGDSKDLVGETGIIVPAKDPVKLAGAWMQLYNMSAEGRRQLGVSARKKIKENYSLDVINERYNAIYSRILMNKNI